MRVIEQRKNRNRTKFILLDTQKCKACWKCIDVCENGVIGKIDLWFHKHSKINKSDNCIGCRKCVKVCEFEAIAAVKKL